MTVTIGIYHVIGSLIVAFIAAVAFIVAMDTFHWPLWACMLVFGFVLLVLAVVIPGPSR